MDNTQNPGYPFAFVPSRQFEAGAESEIFKSPWIPDPVQSLIGNATEFMYTLNVVQPKPLYAAQPLQISVGLQDALGSFELEGMNSL